MNENANFPAFPTESYWGLSKRELFGAMFLQGTLANPEYRGTIKENIESSILIAEEYLKALEVKDEIIPD